MTNPPLDLPAHTGSRTTRLLGAAVLVGVVTMVLLGFFVAPEDDLMADSVRMLFVHVPSAILTYVAFSVTAVGSVMWLWKRSVWWDIVAHSSAEIGVIFCGLTLITGVFTGVSRSLVVRRSSSKVFSAASGFASS